MLHGFGASAEDLVSIADFGPAREFRCIFPQAPKEIVVSGRLMGRAWFPRDEPTLREALFGEFFSRLQGLDPPGLKASGREMVELCDELELDPSATVFAGFSQGAMVAVETALALAAANRKPAALMLFSGALIAQGRWASQVSMLSGMPVFQSHGTLDPILMPEHGYALGNVLDRAGCDRTFYEFKGSHAIPQEALVAAFQSIAGVLST